jgi:hypothetical protein
MKHVAIVGLIFLLASCGSKNNGDRAEKSSLTRINDAYYVAPVDQLRDVAIPFVFVKTDDKQTTTYAFHARRFHGQPDSFTFSGSASERSYSGGPLSTDQFGVALGGFMSRVSGKITKQSEDSVNMLITGEFRGNNLPDVRTYSMKARTRNDTLKILRALYTPAAGVTFSPGAEEGCEAAFSLSCSEVFRP